MVTYIVQYRTDAHNKLHTLCLHFIIYSYTKFIRISYILEPVAGLDAYVITRVACGSMHSMALNQWGQVYSWGSDYHGQLGLDIGENIQPIPKFVRALGIYHIVQICCGQRHSVALANSE